MKVVFYPNDIDSDIIEVPDDITIDELDEMACDWVADNVAGFWKVVEKKKGKKDNNTEEE